MTLMDWWYRAPDALGTKLPTIVKAIFIPWFILGSALVFIPDLREIPSAIRIVLAFPIGAALLWMMLGVALGAIDKVRSFGRRSEERR